MTSHLHIIFNPLVSWGTLDIAACLALAAMIVGGVLRARGTMFRGLTFVVLLGVLANPALVEDQREQLDDTVVLAVDDTASTMLGDRRAQIDKALEAVSDHLHQMPHVKVEVVHVQGSEETNLFQPLLEKLSTIPVSRLAGVIALTDGEVHDRPDRLLGAPFHALIAGHRNEIDRRITVTQAPAYGIVGKKTSLTVRVDDAPEAQSETADVTFRRDDGTSQSVRMPIGKDIAFDVPIDHAGQNLFSFNAAPLPNELTTLNNTAAVTVNGIRDRLRVLLISGEPHIGGRTWRNFLKADPSVDLVHFTILRSPTKESLVPNKEMALITFPVHELFDVKLKSFDLVIFDRFSNRSLVPDEYLDNVAAYVKNGGALLISNATDDGQNSVLTNSPLSQLLPTQTSGQVLTGSFVPDLTDIGRRHPVTSSLETDMPRAKWGPWFRQVQSIPVKGDVLLTGLQGEPVLVLGRAGEGRVAQFLTDQFWLWSRGFGGGGPQADLLRRVAHWLVQEPELDETALRARAEYQQDSWHLTITKRSLNDNPTDVVVTGDDDQARRMSLMPGTQAGVLSGTLSVPKAGLYHIKDGDKEIVVLAGPSKAPEFEEMIATEDKLKPIVEATGGGIYWLADDPLGPTLRSTESTGSQSGRDWIGLRHNDQYRITGSRSYPLWPAWCALGLLLALVMAAWHREGRT